MEIGNIRESGRRMDDVSESSGMGYEYVWGGKFRLTFVQHPAL